MPVIKRARGKRIGFAVAAFIGLLITTPSNETTTEDEVVKKEIERSDDERELESEEQVGKLLQATHTLEEPREEPLALLGLESPRKSEETSEENSSALRIATLTAQLAKIPARLTFENLLRYRELVELEPDNEKFTTKVSYYESRLSPLQKIIGIEDGDTITLLTPNKKQLKIDLAGIDAPELGQDYGRKSKSGLASLMAGKMVFFEETGKGEDDRPKGKIYMEDGTYLNRKAVADGIAWHYTSQNSDPDLAEAQSEARKNKVGIWSQSSKPLQPSEYRERLIVAKRIAAERESARVTSKTRANQTNNFIPKRKVEVQGKYWLNTGTGKRHNEGCRWFGGTNKGRACGPNDGSPCGICGG